MRDLGRLASLDMKKNTRLSSQKNHKVGPGPGTPGPGTALGLGGRAERSLDGLDPGPVVHRVSFGYQDVDEWLKVAQGKKPGHIYGRNTNPTVAAFEEKIKILEGAEAATSRIEPTAIRVGE